MITGDFLGALFFALFAFVVSILVFISERRAPTEARKYVYSPTDAPRIRTPKRTFAIFALTVGCCCLVLAFFAFLHPAHPLGPRLIPPEQMPFLNAVADVLMWIVIAACAAAVGLIMVTTRPLEPDSSSEGDERRRDLISDDASD